MPGNYDTENPSWIPKTVGDLQKATEMNAVMTAFKKNAVALENLIQKISPDNPLDTQSQLVIGAINELKALVTVVGGGISTMAVVITPPETPVDTGKSLAYIPITEQIAEAGELVHFELANLKQISGGSTKVSIKITGVTLATQEIKSGNRMSTDEPVITSGVPISFGDILEFHVTQKGLTEPGEQLTAVITIKKV